jgi:hypothetical protein
MTDIIGAQPRFFYSPRSAQRGKAATKMRKVGFTTKARRTRRKNFSRKGAKAAKKNLF